MNAAQFCEKIVGHNACSMRWLLGSRVASAFEGPPTAAPWGRESRRKYQYCQEWWGQVGKWVREWAEPSQLPLGARQEHTHASSDSSHADSFWLTSRIVLVTGHSLDTPEWTWRCSARTVLPRRADSKFYKRLFLWECVENECESRHAEL